MKIAQETKTTEKDALQMLLSNYRNTPHPATGISPSSMLYRDGERSIFPCVTVTDNAVKEARKRDLATKQQHQEKINAGKYKTDSHFIPGEHVLIRNYRKKRKFDPIFLPDDFKVVEIANDGRCVTVERVSDGTQLKRHPDDLKKFIRPHNEQVTPQRNSEHEIFQQYIQKFAQLANEMEDSYESFRFHNTEAGALPSSSNTRVTRSQGQSLAWNPVMNADDVLLPTGGNNHQISMLDIQEHWV